MVINAGMKALMMAAMLGAGAAKHSPQAKAEDPEKPVPKFFDIKGKELYKFDTYLPMDELSDASSIAAYKRSPQKQIKNFSNGTSLEANKITIDTPAPENWINFKKPGIEYGPLNSTQIQQHKARWQTLLDSIGQEITHNANAKSAEEIQTAVFNTILPYFQRNPNWRNGDKILATHILLKSDPELLKRYEDPRKAPYIQTALQQAVAARALDIDPRTITSQPRIAQTALKLEPYIKKEMFEELGATSPAAKKEIEDYLQTKANIQSLPNTTFSRSNEEGSYQRLDGKFLAKTYLNLKKLDEIKAETNPEKRKAALRDFFKGKTVTVFGMSRKDNGNAPAHAGSGLKRIAGLDDNGDHLSFAVDTSGSGDRKNPRDILGEVLKYIQNITRDIDGEQIVKIDNLIFGSHGMPSSMGLGQPTSRPIIIQDLHHIDRNDNEIFHKIGKEMSAEAPISLQACRTNGVSKYRPDVSVADAVAIYSNRMVAASAEDIPNSPLIALKKPNGKYFITYGSGSQKLLIPNTNTDTKTYVDEKTKRIMFN